MRGLWHVDIMPNRHSIKDEASDADVEQAINTLFEQVHGSAPEAPRAALTSLQGYGAWCQYLEFPPLRKDELDVAVRTKVRKHIPYPPESVHLSYVQVPPIVAGSPKASVFVAAAHHNNIERMTHHLEKCHVELRGVDVTALALVREFVRNHTTPEGRIVGLLNVGFGLSHFVAVLNGYPYYVRDFAPAGGQFTYGFQVGLQVGWEEAERSKRLYDTMQRTHYVELFLKRWMEEVRRTLSHFSTQFANEGVTIQEIYLSGGCAGWTGVAERLSEFLGIPVRIEQWERLARPSSAEGSVDTSIYNVAIGVALEN